MPRPGPRPYECVRRTWHSERHQPIRGSLIQEIFRVVSQIHSSGTKRNKEWQEKLPIVVLKAEDIMYSKANSEAEYMDFTTLWDRVNDAVNTIIRRDDSAETGDFIQPCIEAALHLGCIPRRASRSQRDNDPRRYLSPNPQESISSCHSNLKNSITSPRCLAMYSNIFNNAASMSQPEDFPLHCPLQNSSIPSVASVQGHSVYPLYYWGDDYNSSPTKKSSRNVEDVGFNTLPQMRPLLHCDLSLRLGPSSYLEDINKQVHHQNTKPTNSIVKELSLFPTEDDAKYLRADKFNQKRKVRALAQTHRVEETLCILQPKRHIIHYPG